MDYTKNGQYFDGSIELPDGRVVLAPTREQLIANGWEEVIVPEPVPPTEEELAAMAQEAEQARIAQEALDAEAARLAQIASAKARLTASDYKVIKCAESNLCGERAPYDIASLHAERNALRAAISELEEQAPAIPE